MLQYIAVYFFVAVNLIGLFAMGYDKRQASLQRVRIPERFFFLLTAIGGYFGVGVGMWLFHHKTQKRTFQFKFVLGIIVNIVIITAVFWVINH